MQQYFPFYTLIFLWYFVQSFKQLRGTNDFSQHSGGAPQHRLLPNPNITPGVDERDQQSG